MKRPQAAALSAAAMAGAAVAATLGACGDPAIPRSPEPTTTSQAAQRPDTTTKPGSHTVRPSEAGGEEPAPTRLLAGPLLFRLTGTPKPTQTDGSPQVRYIIIFRLSSGPKAVRNGRSSGNFLIAGGALNPYVFGRPRAHCFAAVVSGKGAEDPEPARRLDNVAAGKRVKVRIQPLTRAASKNKLIDRPYERQPRMRVSGVSSTLASYTLSSPEDFASRSARQAIRRLICT